MQRHHPQNDSSRRPSCQEETSLLLRPQHISMEADESSSLPSNMPSSSVAENHHHRNRSPLGKCYWLRRLGILAAATSVFFFLGFLYYNMHQSPIIPMERATEHYLSVGDGGLSLWYRVWGNTKTGIPTLFVHGGPGNCIADYDNRRFFDKNKLLVIEVDQRGTGRSQPSLRENCQNLQYYRNITIGQMSHDFEILREALGIEQWLVFGGSWGSTLSIDYSERFPERCLGLIVRGVWLNTIPEFEAIFTRNAYKGNVKELVMFDTWFELAAREVEKSGEPPLDPNDGERFFRVYGRMIQRCDSEAIWRHFVWENNMMEENPSKLLDPYNIDTSRLPEATTVAFFENRLFLHGTYDHPSDLIENVDRLKNVSVWICQGLRDKVCPAKYGAGRFANALVQAGVQVQSQFVNGGHEDTVPAIESCLKDSMAKFLADQ